MKKLAAGIATRLWLYSWLTLSVGISVYAAFQEFLSVLAIFPLSLVATALGSLPALGMLYPAIHRINKLHVTVQFKLIALTLLIFLITLSYGSLAGLIDTSFDYFSENDSRTRLVENTARYTAILFGCACVSIAINFRKMHDFFGGHGTMEANSNARFQSQIITNMDTTNTDEPGNVPGNGTAQSNKILVKGLITGILIAILMIPTFLISGLVTERKERNVQVVTEASNSWARSQTLSGPYLFIPYKYTSQYVVILPENLTMNGELIPEDRKRSIYQILLYKSNFTGKGNFLLPLSKDIDTSSLQLSNARICIGLSDFKGIEDKISVTFNGSAYELSPGLPENAIGNTGLSAPVQLSDAELARNIDFNFTLAIKGSGALHFMPLSGNSTYTLSSPWPSPSFEGNTLPSENHITEHGFFSKWVFNKANLPFTTVLQDTKQVNGDLVFGVSILQPVDDYAKTDRCIKYAILFIGLTFSLFFTLEIMQRKPVHPFQYALVGMALVIFYTLLLSISEYIHFDYAYLIASGATVVLISLYAKSHFKKWKIAGIFFTVLGGLYGFNYVLISLEDSALLIGSIGLFIVLATIMYASRKINWYDPSLVKAQAEVARS